MISVICVYNNEEILQSHLLDSLKPQSCLYDLVLIDNRLGYFNSAAAALNHAISLAKGNYYMFVHQDVVFKDQHFLEKLEAQMHDLPEKCIAGAAGIKDRSGIMSSILHGIPAKPAGFIHVTSPQICQTLDEVMIVAPQHLFWKIRFDEHICTGWHLYGVDLCLSAIRAGFNVFVIPVDLYHRSSGESMDKTYFDILRKVVTKHKEHQNTIFTTTGIWPTSKIKLETAIILWRSKDTIRKLIKRTSFGRHFLEIWSERKRRKRQTKF